MDWKLKLKALLHDPPYKILAFGGPRQITQKINLQKAPHIGYNTKPKGDPNRHELHEIWAEELLNYILDGECVKSDEVENADSLASAQSRIVVKPQLQDKQKEKEFEDKSKVDYIECKFMDIFSENEEDIQTPDPEKVQKLFEQLGKLNFSKQDERAKFIFLFLWRFYPEIFPEINKHPADSRAPNHSIYDHLVQTSAIVSALPKPAFLLFTIGPVQSFISKARKTSDLWAGSYMLSYLIWHSMKPLVEELGPDVIIFPNLLRQPLVDRWLYLEISKNSSFENLDEPKFKEWFEKWKIKEKENKTDDDKKAVKDLEEKLTIANLPNRFLAVIPYSNDDERWGQKCQEKFKEKLKDLAYKVFEKIQKYSKNPNPKSHIEDHLLSYFQVYWVIMPWTKDRISKPPSRRDFPNEDEYNKACEEYKAKFVLPVLEDYKELFAENELYETIQEIVNHPYYKPANVGSAYSLLLELTEKLLGARKSVRDFNQLEQPGKKCSLCGEFEVLDINWLELSKSKPGILKGRIRERNGKEEWEGEELCGVCLTKRLFPEIIKEELNLSDEVKFSSTSEMASIGEKRRLKDDIKEEFKKKFNNLKSKGLPSTSSVPKLKGDPLYEIDGQFLMEETYRKDYFEKEYGIIDVEDKDFDEIKSFLKEKGISPSRYYSILQMDGDNMGKWLKGEFNPKIKDTIHDKTRDALIQFSEGEDKEKLEKILCSAHPTSPSIHQVFSRKLSLFALENVKKIVEDDHWGKLVYAGGDDVLAFLPTEEVLKCAYNLQKKFKDVLSPKASMSAGILIVHHKYPLYLALRKVNEAEKKAKEVYGKNSFCIVFMPHSGEERECGGNWELMDFMEDLICKFKTEEISGVFPYQYLDVVEKLYDEDKNKNISNVKEILKNELKRIFMRKEGGDKEKLRKYLEEEILPRFENLEVKNFANILVVARKISGEIKT